MSEADVEIQDEIQEVVEESVSQPTPSEEQIEQEESGEVTEDNSSDNPVSDDYKKGMEAMQAKMQAALDKRISKEVGRRKAIENQFTQFQSEVQELKKSLHKDKPMPKIEDFETEQDFVSAMIDHKMGGKPKQVIPQQEQRPVSSAEIAFTHQEAEYAKNHPEYYNNLSNLNPFLSEDLKQSLYASGPEVTDFLSQNVWEAERISALPASVMGREIALLEQKFKREQPLPRKARQKSAPVTSPTGGTSSSKSLDTMSQADYNRYMADPSKW